MLSQFHSRWVPILVLFFGFRALADGVPSDPGLLLYHGGRVLSSPEAYIVYLGNAWKTTLRPQKANLDEATNFIFSGSYLTSAREYGAGPGKVMSPGGEGVIVSYPDYPYAPKDTEPVNNLVIKTLFTNLMADGVIPYPGPQTAYVLFYDGVSSLNAHHFAGKLPGSPYNAPISVLPSTVGVYGNKFLSHEIIEMVTDPEPGIATAWSTPSPKHEGEIGDLCNANESGLNTNVPPDFVTLYSQYTKNGETKFGGFNVQKYWSNKYNTCIIPGTSQCPEHTTPLYHFFHFANSQNDGIWKQWHSYYESIPAPVAADANSYTDGNAFACLPNESFPVTLSPQQPVYFMYSPFRKYVDQRVYTASYQDAQNFSTLFGIAFGPTYATLTRPLSGTSPLVSCTGPSVNSQRVLSVQNCGDVAWAGFTTVERTLGYVLPPIYQGVRE